MSARQGKVTYSYFFRRKGAIQRKFILKFGTFSRAVNDRPYEWMTIGYLKFDKDHRIVNCPLSIQRSRQIPIQVIGFNKLIVKL